MTHGRYEDGVPCAGPVGSAPAEVEVDERLVRSLLADQHPDLADRPLVELGAGWDNLLWRLGDDLLVRLPRRAIAALLAAQGATVAARAGPPADAAGPGSAAGGEAVRRLPVAVVGRPVARRLPWGSGASHGAAGRRPAARPLPSRTHHQAPLDAPANPYRGVPLAQRAATVGARLCELSSEVDMARTRGVWNWASAASPWSGPRCWVHGDLHPANVLVGGGTLAAVIDFGDLCAGDPATTSPVRGCSCHPRRCLPSPRRTASTPSWSEGPSGGFSCSR